MPTAIAAEQEMPDGDDLHRCMARLGLLEESSTDFMLCRLTPTAAAMSWFVSGDGRCPDPQFESIFTGIRNRIRAFDDRFVAEVLSTPSGTMAKVAFVHNGSVTCIPFAHGILQLAVMDCVLFSFLDGIDSETLHFSPPITDPLPAARSRSGGINAFVALRDNWEEVIGGFMAAFDKATERVFVPATQVAQNDRGRAILSSLVAAALSSADTAHYNTVKHNFCMASLGLRVLALPANKKSLVHQLRSQFNDDDLALVSFIDKFQKDFELMRTVYYAAVFTPFALFTNRKLSLDNAKKRVSLTDTLEAPTFAAEKTPSLKQMMVEHAIWVLVRRMSTEGPDAFDNGMKTVFDIYNRSIGSVCAASQSMSSAPFIRASRTIKAIVEGTRVVGISSRSGLKEYICRAITSREDVRLGKRPAEGGAPSRRRMRTTEALAPSVQQQRSPEPPQLSCPSSMAVAVEQLSQITTRLRDPAMDDPTSRIYRIPYSEWEKTQLARKRQYMEHGVTVCASDRGTYPPKELEQLVDTEELREVENLSTGRLERGTILDLFCDNVVEDDQRQIRFIPVLNDGIPIPIDGLDDASSVLLRTSRNYRWKTTVQPNLTIGSRFVHVTTLGTRSGIQISPSGVCTYLSTAHGTLSVFVPNEEYVPPDVRCTYSKFVLAKGDEIFLPPCTPYYMVTTQAPCTMLGGYFICLAAVAHSLRALVFERYFPEETTTPSRPKAYIGYFKLMDKVASHFLDGRQTNMNLGHAAILLILVDHYDQLLLPGALSGEDEAAFRADHSYIKTVADTLKKDRPDLLALCRTSVLHYMKQSNFYDYRVTHTCMEWDAYL